MEASSYPNVLIVVLDCVRAKSIYPWAAGGVHPPCITELCQSSTVFERCLAPSSWSVPSHGSIFTGQYPWTHRAYGRNKHLEGARTLFTDLGEIGYSTLSLSANPFISAKLGFTDGVEDAYWGDWPSHYLRFLGDSHPPSGFHRGKSRPAAGITLSSHPRRWLTAAVDSIHMALPGSWKGLELLSSRVLMGTDRVSKVSAPWIEPTLDAWLRSVAPSSPVGCFVNLMDAHEPYLEKTSGSPRTYSREEVRLLVDGKDRDREDLAADRRRLAELERRYLESIEVADRRLSSLLRVFWSHRDVNSTLLFVTSDHGQSFGEGGQVFHEYASGDQVLRVPLLVKFPNGRFSGLRARSWTSLIDIAPTALGSLGRRNRPSLEGRDLAWLADSKRPEPVMAVGEGHTPFRSTGSDGDKGVTRLSQPSVVGCLEEVRVEMHAPDWEPSFTLEGSDQVYDLRALGSAGGTPQTTDSVAGTLARCAERVAQKLTSRSDVGSRLQSWGY